MKEGEEGVGILPGSDKGGATNSANSLESLHPLIRVNWWNWWQTLWLN
jgi:hypothetical protein